MRVGVEEDKTGASLGGVMPAARARALVAALGLLMTGMAASGAQAESRTISMYHVHTKERITVTYWKDGRFIPSALRKLNWFLRDWRRNKAVRMDPRTIDLIWKLHADLGSKEPIHIISGHRSARTNAMLRRIGRRVARRSRHITGQAIDFKFPDVPTWKVRYLALAYGIGGVGYYRHNGFVHVDTGKVRHWPRMSQRRLASVINKYRRMIGRGYRRGNNYIMLAKAGGNGSANRRTNFNRRSQALLNRRDKSSTPKMKAGEVLLAAAGATGAKHAKGAASSTVKAQGKPVPLPGVKPVLLTAATRADKAATTVPTPKARPYEVLVLAASRMEITPVSAPATITNFARGKSTRDPIGVVIASLPQQEVAPVPQQRPRTSGRQWPKVMRAGKGDLAVALAEGTARGVPTLAGAVLHAPATDVVRSGKGDMMIRGSLGMSAEELAVRNGAPMLGNNVQQANMYWPGAQVRPVPDRVNRPQRVNRSGKGDLLASTRLPENIRKAALERGALAAGKLQPIGFR